MSKPARVGVFLLGGFVLFGIGIFLIGNRQKAFSRNYEIYAEFASLNGLQNGATARISGFTAGEVRDMYLPRQPSGRFRVKVRLQEKFAHLVRTDSVASIETEGVVGNEFLEIAKGTDKAPQATPGSTIPSREPVDFNVLVAQGTSLLSTTQSAIDKLQGDADLALKSINAIASNAGGLLESVRGDIKHMTDSGNRIASNLNEIVAGIQQGHGAAGKLLKDKNVEASIDETLRNFRDGSTNLNQASANANKLIADLNSRDIAGHADQTIENARQLTEQLKSTVQSLLAAKNHNGQDAATEMRQTITNTNRSLGNIADDSEALKRNFFLRGFFKRRGYYNLAEMTPERYRKSGFVKSDGARRAWVPADALFAGSIRTDSDEREDNLSEAGKAQIDSAMSQLVAFLPNSPLVVEGYASRGSASERFLAAKHRAELARDYVQQRYGLNPKLVAIMPLVDANKDGVGLSLLPEPH